MGKEEDEEEGASCQNKASLQHNWTSVVGGFLQGDCKMTPQVDWKE